jgi:hypothetical protein
MRLFPVADLLLKRFAGWALNVWRLERLNAPIRNPHLADIDASTVVNDFLHDFFRRVVTVEMEIAAGNARVDQQCVELKAFSKHPDG